MERRHFVKYERDKLYSLVESLNSGELAAEIFRENNRIIESKNSKNFINMAELIVDIAIREMEMIENFPLKEKEEYYNANFSHRQAKEY